MLAAVVLAAFLPTLAGGFVPLDDDVNFVHNLAYRGLGQQQLAWMFTTRSLGHYIPLSWMSLGLDYLVWGMNPFGYHLTNVLLHLANALLLLYLARALLQKAWPRPEDGGAVTAGALTAALAFAVHPLRVESVAWITERRDVLCGFFVLWVLILYVAMAEASGRRRWRLLAGSCLLYAAALLAKGIAVALPVSLFALDFSVLRRCRRERSAAAGPTQEDGRWALVLEKIPYLLLAAGGMAAALWSSQPVRELNAELGLGPRLAATAYGLTFYLRATLVPVNLPFFIAWPRSIALAQPQFGLLAVLVIALAALCWALRRRFPAVVAAAVSYAAWVLPVSGLFQAGPQLAAHRYTYLACLPWALLAGAGVTRLTAAGARRVAVAIGLTAATALLVVETRRQAALWNTSLSFSRAAVASAPTFWLPRYHLARSQLLAGHWREAANEVRAGLRDNPDAPYLMKMGALLFATSPDPSVRSGGTALELARRAVDDSDPPDGYALYALAAAQAETGDFDAAELTAQEAVDNLEETPDEPLAHRLAAALALFEREKPLRLGPADWF